MVEGKLQRESGVTHIIVSRCFDLAKLFKGVKLPEAAEPALFTGQSAAGTLPADLEGTGQPNEKIRAVIPAARNFK